MSKVSARHRLGVWKSLDEVPRRRRLGEMAADFPHEEPWDAFIEHRSSQLGWDSFDKYGRAGEYWQDYMADQDRHYALADPEHVEGYIHELRNGGPRGSRTTRTVYSNYFAPLNGFYKWLMNHVEYRHAYSPVYLAVVNYEGDAQDVWRSFH